MSTNPYQSPSVYSDPINGESRLAALRSVRSALLILLIPALFNFASFHLLLGFPLALGIINGIGLVSVGLLVWFYGLSTLEWITQAIHSFFAKKSLDEWNQSLYVILKRAPLYSVPGAILWAIWITAFYQFKFDFYQISVPIGIAAHLLAACLYIPLFYRWYRLENAPS